MIGGFSKYLIDRGWKRYRDDYVNGKRIEYEEYESLFVSTYGPLFYFYKHPDFVFQVYWGLCVKDVPPKYHLDSSGLSPVIYLDLDYEKAYDQIIERQKQYEEMRIKYKDFIKITEVAGKKIKTTFDTKTCRFKNEYI